MADLIKRAVNYIPWATTPKKAALPPLTRTPVNAPDASNTLKVPVLDPRLMLKPPIQMFPNQSVSYADTGGYESPYTLSNNNVQFLNPNWMNSDTSPGYISNTSVTPTGGGGGGGGYGGGYGGGGGTVQPVQPDISWSEGYSVDNAPDWWRGLVPSAFTPDSEYVALYNAMIPYMSPEDQRTAGKYLYSVIGDQQAEPWNTYNPEMMEGITPPAQLSTELKEEFTSSDRVQNALGTLTKLIEVSGREEKAMGEGYEFLRSLLSTIGEFGGGSVGSGQRQTRAQYNQTQAALDPMLSQARSGELSPYSAVAQQIASPFFSAGSVTPVAKNAAGRFVFGNRNPEFFG